MALRLVTRATFALLLRAAMDDQFGKLPERAARWPYGARSAMRVIPAPSANWPRFFKAIKRG